MRLIDADALIEAITEHCRSEVECLHHFWYDENIVALIDNAPTVETDMDFAKECYAVGYEDGKTERPQGEFSRKDLESWLYQIAMNNIGTDFEKSVVDIIHRLDGFERFVSEQKGGED